MLCILWNTKFLLLRLIVLFRANCLEEFTGSLQFNTYIIMLQRNVRHTELRAILNIQILKVVLFQLQTDVKFHIQECLLDATSVPTRPTWLLPQLSSMGNLRAEGLPPGQRTLCLSHQPSSQACKEFPSSLYILCQESLNCSSMVLSSPVLSRYLEIPGLNPLLTKCFINDQHLHQILMGRNVFEYLFLSLPYLRMCLRNQLGQKFLPKFSAAKLSHVYRNLHYKQLPPF